MKKQLAGVDVDFPTINGKFIHQLEEIFTSRIKVVQAGAQKYAIQFPMYKTDGGMYLIYLVSENGAFYLSDEATTMRELDKIFELSEPDVVKNISAILRQYNCQKNGNNITIACTSKDVHLKMSYLIQAISFMLNMKIFYT